MAAERFVVVDTNFLVDAALHMTGMPRYAAQANLTWAQVDAVWKLFAAGDMVVAGELVKPTPVFCQVVLRELESVLCGPKYRFSTELFEKVFRMIAVAFNKANGLLDRTVESSEELAKVNWATNGTGNGDVAVRLCADRHSAAVLTADWNLGKYCEEFSIASFTAPEMLAARQSDLVAA